MLIKYKKKDWMLILSLFLIPNVSESLYLYKGRTILTKSP